ncbi:UDP-N-acetylglucosamine 4,6-dehydratase (inverting) [Candidatus Falkowbacteria bacterium CG11_big_fil_rev_8_21_14_0_20_39_10]|uniref:UDP-N-acetylglucosamine 4,6-dehydratase (Inverting) n=1 Tax=Candidatus Falkowbacteria bacterium CG11_big_fil_rev_8_21_14_0_20_39_10 TaxID=1974570 RepID=A0A2M6K9J4_9BACT|nr:MAG: UDP-N-acetylglucosamine 4,6-dehydratase (inverting) [Candidatus Falkowbacteria bacterium CG11_big_fil_rev_8_21_14_0_20_39_10]
MDCLKNKTILVTGGTGSFGKSFIKFLLANSEAQKIIVFSRDELKQFHMQQEITDERIRFFLGDVRDLQRLQRAFNGVDVVVHAAALKQVPTLEYNPFEAVKTNINGSQNVINAAIDQGVKKVLLVSTDKAAQPANLYGATKLCAEKLFISGNSYTKDKTRFSCVRYGNVLGSRGSIVEALLNNNLDKVKITDLEMTRFWITLRQAFDLVLFALENMAGGEIFIPKIPSMKLVDLFDALVPGIEREIIGIRPGEKLHEVLLTEQEAKHSLELENYYVVLPEFNIVSSDKYQKYFDKVGKRVECDFRFASDTNKDWFTIEQLKELIKSL